MVLTAEAWTDGCPKKRITQLGPAEHLPRSGVQGFHSGEGGPGRGLRTPSALTLRNPVGPSWGACWLLCAPHMWGPQATPQVSVRAVPPLPRTLQPSGPSTRLRAVAPGPLGLRGRRDPACLPARRSPGHQDTAVGPWGPLAVQAAGPGLQPTWGTRATWSASAFAASWLRSSPAPMPPNHFIISL